MGRARLSESAESAAAVLDTLLDQLVAETDVPMAEARLLTEGVPLLVELPPAWRAVYRQTARDTVPTLEADVLDASLAEYERRAGIHRSDSVAPRPPQSWKPFPTRILPDVLRRYVEEVAAAIGCDPSFPAIAVLAALGGCIGNRRRILLKRGWAEPPVLWAAIVAQSGTKKSPALAAVFQHLHWRESQEIDGYRRRFDDYQQELQEWTATPAATRGERPAPPSPARRLLVSDVTVEALASLMAAAPGGLLLCRDELAGWIRGFDQYKSGRSGEAQAWLEMHRAGTVIVDRKSSPTLSVPRAAVSVVGSIQPEVLRASLSGEHLVDGLAARLLFAMPPEMARKWTDNDIDEAIEAEFATLIDTLLALPFADDEYRPVELPLNTDAHDVFVEFYDANAQRIAEADGVVAAALSKIEGYAARLALIVALTTNPHAAEIDALSMGRGVALASWFADEAQRVYGTFSEDRCDRERRELVDWISARGGEVTVRDLARGPRRYREPGAAEAALHDLVELGWGAWLAPEKAGVGGRPRSRVFRLRAAGDGDSAPSVAVGDKKPKTDPKRVTGAGISQRTLATEHALPPGVSSPSPSQKHRVETLASDEGWGEI